MLIFHIPPPWRTAATVRRSKVARKGAYHVILPWPIRRIRPAKRSFRGVGTTASTVFSIDGRKNIVIKALVWHHMGRHSLAH
jgi:hypothetical protein